MMQFRVKSPPCTERAILEALSDGGWASLRALRATAWGQRVDAYGIVLIAHVKSLIASGVLESRGGIDSPGRATFEVRLKPREVKA